MVLHRHRLCVSSETNPESQRITKAKPGVQFWPLGQSVTPGPGNVASAKPVSPRCLPTERGLVWAFTGKVAHKALGMLSGDLVSVSTTLKLDP